MRLLCSQILLAMYGACQTFEQLTKVEGYPGTGPVVAPAQNNSPLLSHCLDFWRRPASVRRGF